MKLERDLGDGHKKILVRSVVPHDVEQGLEVRVTTLWTRGSEDFLRH